MENGKAAVAVGLTNGFGFGSTEFHVLRSYGSVLPKFIYHFIRQESFRQNAAEEMTGSVGQKRVPVEFLNHTVIPLPPLAEQYRIVAKVEELLARVTTAREELTQVPTILKRFRQSVLTAACTGRLTDAWRADNPGTESAEELLARIGVDKERTADTSDPDEPALPAFPDKWAVSTCGALAERSRGITYGVIKLGPPVAGGIPTLRSSDVRPLYIDETGVKCISPLIAEQYSRTFLRGGELLVTVRGTLGGVAVVPSHMNGYNVSREVAVVPLHPAFSARFFALAVASDVSTRWLATVAKGVAYTGINIKDLRRVPVPVPPLAEQHEIVRRVDDLFKLADAIERRSKAATARVEWLTQAILAKAFRGELVPTEAELARSEGRDFESASVVLERIRAEGAAAETNGAAPRATRPRRQRAEKPSALDESEPPESTVGPMTTPAEVEPAGTRRHAATNGQPPPIDDIDRNEVLATIRQVFTDGQARDRETAIQDIARALGYRRVGARIHEILTNDIQTAVRRGILDNTGGQLSLLCRSIDDYSREHLVEMLLGSMGAGWQSRGDAIAAAARHLGYRRTGPAIRAAFKSAINSAIRGGRLEREGAELIRRSRGG